MKDDVSEKVKVKRLNEVMEMYYKFLPEVQGKYVGQIQLVLVEKVSSISEFIFLPVKTIGFLYLSSEIVISEIPMSSRQLFLI